MWSNLIGHATSRVFTSAAGVAGAGCADWRPKLLHSSASLLRKLRRASFTPPPQQQQEQPAELWRPQLWPQLWPRGCPAPGRFLLHLPFLSNPSLCTCRDSLGCLFRARRNVTNNNKKCPPLLHICPRTATDTATCVLILPYMCPHTATRVPSYCYMCPHTATYVPSYCYMCPQTVTHVSSYCYMCPHTATATHVSSQVLVAHRD